MRAVLVEDGRLVLGTAPTPQPSAGEVQIAVAASGLNRADLLQVAGGYPPPPGASPILGLECSGMVTAVGEGVMRVAPGDAVCALLAGGGYAETVVAPAGQVLKIPAGGLSVADAAALPEAFATAWLNLYMEAGLARRERVLVHAGASGVGTAAIQLCKASGNPVFVTVGDEAKLARCLALGASAGCNRRQGSFAGQLAEWTQQAGVDVILDPVGGAYLKDNLASLARDGRLILIGLMGGAKAEIALGAMLMKRQRLIGSTLRARSVAAKSAIMDGLKQSVWPAVEAGAIKPIIEARFPAGEAQAAQELLASNRTFGKVLLIW